MWPERTSISVCPSGFAETSACVAVAPFAPGRFSTMIGTPSVFSRSLAISREIMSPVPPAVKPTSQRMGPDGHVCAWATLARPRYKESATRPKRFIASSRLFRRSLQISAGPATWTPQERCREKCGPGLRPASRQTLRKPAMSDDITFDKSFDLPPGKAAEVVPGVRRVLADNGGPFTFKGTLTYIVGKGKVAIIDPGPDDPAHIAAVLDAVRNETVTHIFVTHTHRDHSPAVPAIKAATGAAVYAEGPHRASRPLNAGEAPRMEAANDMDFRPDHMVADGEVIEGDGFALEGITTPGHTANHMAFALKGTDVMFSGDHVMGWSTTI